MRSALLRHTLALLATLAALLVSACSRRDTPSTNSSSASPSPTIANTLHVGIGGEPSELDPHIINAPPDYQADPTPSSKASR
jgi:ABC-type transport system substrate-binding protein